MSVETMMVGIHQAEPGSGIHDQERGHYREAGVQILVLPEYFWVRSGDRHHRDAALHYAEDREHLLSLSREEPWAWASTHIEPDGDRLYNTTFVFQKGKELGRYRKMNLMPGEARHGVSAGEEFALVDIDGIKVAPVICADVLYPETFAQVAALHPDLVVAPMASPHRPQESSEDKDLRDREIFLGGAAAANTVIAKAGGTGLLFGRRLQGRCLVAAPDELLFRTPFHEEAARRTWVVPVPRTTPSR